MCIRDRGSSSAMPQKRNPISSEVILACSKLLREHHSAMLDSMVLDHERATGNGIWSGTHYLKCL